MRVETESLRSEDPALFAAELRSLASNAHRMMNDSSSSPAEAKALASHVARLKSRVFAKSSHDLLEWLSNLERQLDDRSVTRPETLVTPGVGSSEYLL